MRDYAKVAPQFWTGKTGKALRAQGSHIQVCALYLITCPSANMIGVYYLPMPTLCHETGSTLEGASEALRSLSEVGFSRYDAPSEYVFVPEMAFFQIGPSLSPKDNRHVALLRELEIVKKTPFYDDFMTRYRTAYHLDEGKPLESPLEAPSKPEAGTGTRTEKNKRAQKTSLPEPFGLSDRVLKWAAQHGLAGVIELHLEAFVSTCRAKGYQYLDWDEAFMNAVRKNWAQIPSPANRGGVAL